MQVVNDQVPPPVRLTIPGNFWDSQIYSGHLYLFGLDGDLIVLDWERLIRELPITQDLRVAATSAFLGNHRLYGPGAHELIRDPEIRPLLVSKFSRLAGSELTMDFFYDEVIVHRDNPLPFPHNDSELHYRRLYIGCKSGVFGLDNYSLMARSKIPRPDSLWDGPAFDLSASHSVLAVAAGGEGLFEVGVSRELSSGSVTEPRHIARNACTMCDWAYLSVFGSAHGRPGFLAAFDRVLDENSERRVKKYIRKFDRVVPATDLFGTERSSTSSFMWGGKDKFYRYSSNRIDVVQYNPPYSSRKDENEFATIGTIALENWKGDIVSARVVPFGTVIECDNALVVLPSVGDSMTLPGEPVNWRVFPRSENYINQLHVIYDDRLEVWAFNHDYFADQHLKLAGTKVSITDDRN